MEVMFFVVDGFVICELRFVQCIRMSIRRQVFLRNQSLQQPIVPLGDGIFGGWPIRRHLPPTSAIRLPNRGFIAW